jgi:4,5-DOPA dioxygenase extradiol
MSSLMPAAFLGHGNPMNALDSNRYTAAWRAFGAGAPRPRAVLVVSAHWFISATAVTAMQRPRTIHDFYGFPDELFEVEYPAPGAPELAEEVAEVVRPVWVGADADSWGLDHGTWSVLTHVFPDADVPVVQLSIDATKPLEEHVDLGRRLAPLRASGVMVIGSGNVVHHLGRIDWSKPDDGYDWAHRFDDAARDLMTDDPGRILDLVDHPDWPSAVPTTDHFIPLLYLAGLADASAEQVTTLVDGCSMGSLSMISYGLGLDVGGAPDAGGAAAELPLDTPPESTNL